jgi:hypothetical protein
MTTRKRAPIETLAPSRNFTITLADRMRAAAGPIAYMTRRRTIEDLEDALLEMIAPLLATGDPIALEAGLKKRAFTARLARLNTLIETHNRYYPSEANLPLDPRTGEMLERGAPWRPLERATIERLVGRVRDLIEEESA